jgi:hypothetical protein
MSMQNILTSFYGLNEKNKKIERPDKKFQLY